MNIKHQVTLDNAKQEDLHWPTLACGECKRLLVRDRSGFLHCPLGHGKLTCEQDCQEEDEMSFYDWAMESTDEYI